MSSQISVNIRTSRDFSLEQILLALSEWFSPWMGSVEFEETFCGRKEVAVSGPLERVIRAAFAKGASEPSLDHEEFRASGSQGVTISAVRRYSDRSIGGDGVFLGIDLDQMPELCGNAKNCNQLFQSFSGFVAQAGKGYGYACLETNSGFFSDSQFQHRASTLMTECGTLDWLRWITFYDHKSFGSISPRVQFDKLPMLKATTIQSGVLLMLKQSPLDLRNAEDLMLYCEMLRVLRLSKVTRF